MLNGLRRFRRQLPAWGELLLWLLLAAVIVEAATFLVTHSH